MKNGAVKYVTVDYIVNPYSKCMQGVRRKPLNLLGVKRVKRVPLHSGATYTEGYRVQDRAGFTHYITLDSLPKMFKAIGGDNE